MTADSRMERGLRAQLARRQEALDAGAEPLGWKIGLNAPPVMEKLGIAAPVIGYLTSAGRLAPGESCDLSGATLAAVEPEIAIHLSRDVAGGTPADVAREAIGALGCAVEVVDIDLPFEDLEAILAGNVFHRFVLLPSGEAADTASARAIVERNGELAETAQSIPDLDQLAKTVAHVADLLASQGETLHAGEAIIAGSLTPLVPVASGDLVRIDFGAFGAAELRFV